MGGGWSSRGFLAFSLCVLPSLWPTIAFAGAPDPLNAVVAKLRDGDVAEALVSVEALSPELQAVPRIAYLHARLLDQLGRRDEALPILVAAVTSPSEDASALPASVREEANKRRASWEAASANNTARAAAPTPATSTPRTPQEKLDRAEKLLNAGREEAAAEMLRATPPRSLRGRWYHVRGLALFRMRNHYDEAARVLAMAASAGGETQAFDAFHAARALARADQNSRSIVELRKFAKRFSKSSYAAEALYIAAWLELRMNRSAGFRNMEAFVRSDLAKASAEFKHQALWTLGYYAYTHDKLQDAIRYLEQAASTTSEEMAQGAANYWCARAKLDAGDQAGAITIWNAIIDHDPFHWYALLSRARLSQLHSAPAMPAAVTDESAPATTETPLPEDAAFYAGIGLFDDAESALRKQESAIRSASAAPEGLRNLVSAYHAIDEYARPYHLTIAEHARSLMTAWTPDTDWVWRTTMATPHITTVQREASEHGLDASYVYAIMRKESAFDPKVVSYADAYGLMQLLLGTAVKVARKLGDTEPTRDDLFRPAINIRLGTALLAQLETELGPERALSMAAYNAGSHRVHQWLKHVSARELDRFVEEIPIDQTRNYVRRVHANWARYRYFYERDREPITLNLVLQ